MDDDFDPLEPGIKGLSGFYDVLQEYIGYPVRIILKHHDTTVAGTVHWVGAHIAELEVTGGRWWVVISDISAISTPPPLPEDERQL